VFVTPSLSRSFDFAGGWLLVQEAGGMSTDLDGRSLDGIELGLKKSAPVLACGNQRLHERAMELLR
jgi:fructose-1,6-bisphosphatase/inositol monophosphatase family enzyme